MANTRVLVTRRKAVRNTRKITKTMEKISTAKLAKAQNAAVGQILDKPDDASVSIGAVMGISPDDVKKQFAGYEYLPAKEQASPDFLGGKLATDLQDTAGFLLKQGGITAVSPPDAYVAGVDAKPAEAAAQ